jgi:hypothetical protein
MNSPSTDRDYKARAWTRIEEAIRRIKPYYNVNTGGGSLHIALDDGNMEADHILFCLRWAEEHDDKDAVALAKLLLDMSIDERYELYERYDEYA